RDSSAFLGELCTPPEQPPLLLLLTYRGEEPGSNSTLAYLHQVLANQRVLGTCHELGLDELSDAESRQLVQELLRTGQHLTQGAQAAIVQEARGHPLFIQQLARFAGSAGMATDATRRESFTLRTVRQDRVRDLPAFARELLELTCIAAQPLTPAILFAAAEAGGPEGRAEALPLLIRERLARSASASSESGRRVEAFHDQVRTAVVDLLAIDLRRARHARLAHVLAQQP